VDLVLNTNCPHYELNFLGNFQTRLGVASPAFQSCVWWIQDPAQFEAPSRDGLVALINPPANLLKLATRAKLHMDHLIYDSWYFSWIPLSERCRIDLKIIQFWHVQMKIWIYLCYGQIVKVGQQTHVGSEAQQSRLFILGVAYNRRWLSLIWTHSSSHIRLSLSPHWLGTYFWAATLSTRAKERKDRRWPGLTRFPNCCFTVDHALTSFDCVFVRAISV